MTSRALRPLVFAFLILMPLAAGAQTRNPPPIAAGEQVLKAEQLEALVVQVFKGHVAQLKEFCFQNPDMPIMQAVEKQIDAKK